MPITANITKMMLLHSTVTYWKCVAQDFGLAAGRTTRFVTWSSTRSNLQTA